MQYRGVRSALRHYDPQHKYITPEYAKRLLDWMGVEVNLVAPLGAELVAEATERVLAGRSGVYDVTVRVGAEVVAEFRGRSRQVPGLPPPG